MAADLINFAKSVYDDFGAKSHGALHQYIFLRRLNEEDVMFFRKLVLQYPEMIGKVYTPTVGTAILHYHLIERFFHPDLGPFTINKDIYKGNADKKKIKGIIKKKLLNFARRRHDFISGEKLEIKGRQDLLAFAKKLLFIVTDSGRILGIGDQGKGGAEITFGKFNCYFLGVPFNPAYFMPLGLDVGTDNQGKKMDPLYDGLHRNRMAGEEYTYFVRLVLEAIDELDPVILQFEDFKGEKAWEHLTWFQEKSVACFNDDIQGTGAIALAGLLGAERKGMKMGKARFLFLGAGGAGSGMAQQVKWLYKDAKIYMFDSKGLLYQGRKAKAKQGKKEFTTYQEPYILAGEGLTRLKASLKTAGWVEGECISPSQVIDCFGCDVIIGTSAHSGVITEDLITKAQKTASGKLLVLAMSNPTSKCEILSLEESACYNNVDQLQQNSILKKAVLRTIAAAQGNIILATGSPFPDSEYKGKTYRIGQANNLFIFPGLAYGTWLVGADKISKSMFISAARAVSAMLDEDDLEKGRIYPNIASFSNVSEKVALHTAVAAINDASVKVADEFDAMLHLSRETQILAVEKALKNSFWMSEMHITKQGINKAADFDFEEIESLL